VDNYLLFFIVSTITILSPGPGVLFTLTNTLRYGVGGSLGGIIGVALGTFIVATVSATSVGVIIAASPLAFMLMKYIGAVYLIYLGIKLWRASPPMMDTGNTLTEGAKIQLFKGLTMQLTNPKIVFFFLSVFPQFINFSQGYGQQFFLLVMTYCTLLLALHFIYALLATKTRRWLTSEKGGRRVNRIGGAIFMSFGLGLALASQ
jgi:threonine/homoserine/homoserine lactone efflux protein